MVRWTITGIGLLFFAVFVYTGNWPAAVLMVIVWFMVFSMIGAHVTKIEDDQRIAVLEGLINQHPISLDAIREASREQGH